MERHGTCYTFPSKLHRVIFILFKLFMTLVFSIVFDGVMDVVPLVEYIYLVFTRMPGKSLP